MASWLTKYFSAAVRYLGVNLPMRGFIDVVGDGVVVSDEVLDDGTPVTRLTIPGGTVVPGASGEFIYNNGGVLGATTNVKYGATWLSIGTSPATTGAIRLNASGAIVARNTINSGNCNLVGLDASNNVIVGATDGVVQNTRLYSAFAAGCFAGASLQDYVYAQGGGLGVHMGTGGIDRLTVGTLIKAAVPRVGDSTPYGSDGRGPLAMANANQTVPASVYSRHQVKLTGTNTAVRTATFPAPSDEDHSYSLHIECACTGFGVLITTGAGTTVLMLPGQSLILDFSPSGVKPAHANGDPDIMGIALSASSTEAIPSTDITSTSSIYALKYRSTAIALFDGSSWVRRVIPDAGISLALSGLTTNKQYDVFASWNGSAVVLSLGVAWTNDTTRATALDIKDGVDVANGDPTKRFIGTFRAASATTTKHTSLAAWVDNAYHAIVRTLEVKPSDDSWANTSSSWHLAGATTGPVSASYVSCRPYAVVDAKIYGAVNTTTAGTAFAFGLGVDQTNATDNDLGGSASLSTTSGTRATAFYVGRPGLGYHVLNYLELGGAGVTSLGDAGSPDRVQSGFIATIED